MSHRTVCKPLFILLADIGLLAAALLPATPVTSDEPILNIDSNSLFGFSIDIDHWPVWFSGRWRNTDLARSFTEDVSQACSDGNCKIGKQAPTANCEPLNRGAASDPV